MSSPGGAVEAEHNQAEGNGFAQTSVKMDSAIDFHGWEEDGDGRRGQENLPEAVESCGINLIGYASVGGGMRA